MIVASYFRPRPVVRTLASFVAQGQEPAVPFWTVSYHSELFIRDRPACLRDMTR